MYRVALFNIGKLESRRENYDKAELAYIQCLRLYQDAFDPHACQELIQLYFHRKEYKKAVQYEDTLRKAHEAYKKGYLSMIGIYQSDKFCFDKFKWNDNFIKAYKKIEEDPNISFFNKYIHFYVENSKGRIDTDSTIHKENLPETKPGEKKWLLTMGSYSKESYFIIDVNNIKYDDLKKIIVEILEGKIKPTTKPTK